MRSSKKAVTDNLKKIAIQNDNNSKELIAFQKSDEMLRREIDEMKKNALGNDQANLMLQKSYDDLKIEFDDLKQSMEKYVAYTKEIADVRKSNDLLIKENRKLDQQLRESESKYFILQNIAGDVTKSDEHVVVIDDMKNQQGCVDCPKFKRKEESLKKENCVLNDQVLELKEKFERLDKFYATVIETKDKTINECMQISDGGGTIKAMFQRLLLHYKAENELKSMLAMKEVVTGDKGGTRFYMMLQQTVILKNKMPAR